MNKKSENLELKVVQPDDVQAVAAEELDEDEKEFRALRRDLPGMAGASAVGMTAISVGKAPQKNQYFRTSPEFYMVTGIVDQDLGMEKHFFAVTREMEVALHGIGITVADYALYWTITSQGASKIIPVRLAGPDGEQNEYARTKQIGLEEAKTRWVRLFTDMDNKCYRTFPAPDGRFSDPIFPALKPAKVFRLAFRDRGHLIDSTEHAYYKRLAARDTESDS
jgi:hypothetical protein